MKCIARGEEIVHWLRVFTALAEDQSSVFSTIWKLLAIVTFPGNHIALFGTPEMHVVGFCIHVVQ